MLIIDGDAELVGPLAEALALAQLEVCVAPTAKAGLEIALSDAATDLVILELVLPDLQGTEVCRRIRADERTRELPIILYSRKDDELSRIVGFEVGADDFVAKPFSTRELVLRIRALLRRTRRAMPTPHVRAGPLTIDREGHRVWVDDQEILLTALEFKLLVAFVERTGRVQTREALLAEVWEMYAGLTTRTVDTNIKRLREKLGAAGELIETLRGVGYRFRLEPDD